MSKKHMNMKYILSVVLAIVLAFAPMTSLKAMADEGEQDLQLCTDIVEHHVLRGTIITDDGDILTYPEETIDAHLMLTKDYDMIEENAYLTAVGSIEEKLNGWASSNGYTQGSINTTAGENNITQVFYDPSGNVIQASDFYDGCWTYDSGECTVIHYYYYDALTGRTAPPAYEVMNSFIDFNECAQDDVAFSVDCLSTDEITGVFIDGQSTDSEGNVEITWSEYTNSPFVTLKDDFFAEVPTGQYMLKVMFEGDKESSGTPVYVTKWSLDCVAGNNSNYEPGSGVDLDLTFDAYPDEVIDGVSINGDSSIPADKYSVIPDWNNSTLTLRISHEYLDEIYKDGVESALINPHFKYAERYSNAIFTLHTYTYEVLEGDEQEYDPTAGSDAVIKIDGPDAEVVSVVVDDVTLDADDYTIEHGSTVLTLKDDYLKTLATGEHQITVNYNGDKVANATITVKEATNQGSGENQGEGGSTGGNTEGGSQGGNTEGGNEGGTTGGNTEGGSGNEGGSQSGGTEGGNNEGGSTGGNTEGENAEGGSQGGTTEGGNTEGGNNGNTQPAEKPEDGETTGKENGTTQNETGKESGKQDGSDKNSGKEVTSGQKDNSTDKNTEKKPNTGDNGVTVALALFMMSMVGICGAMYARKKAVREN